jgi:hypothetical protein
MGKTFFDLIKSVNGVGVEAYGDVEDGWVGEDDQESIVDEFASIVSARDREAGEAR